MPMISTFGATYCNINSVVEVLSEKTGYGRVDDSDITAQAGRIFGTPKAKLEQVFSGTGQMFNRFTHEKEYCIAQIKQALAQRLIDEDGLMINGFVGQLIPKSVSHVFRVCLIADLESRIEAVIREKNLSEEEALYRLRGEDEDRAAWLHRIHHTDDPWEPSLYDVVASTDKLTATEIADLVCTKLKNDAVQPTARSMNAINDFLLASRVEAAMFGAGHDVHVEARVGTVTLTINRQVLLLGRLKQELESILEKILGVHSVRIAKKATNESHTIHRSSAGEKGPHVLLVDDEREFVQGLSERLTVRHMLTTVNYDGESALETLKDTTPEVMVLDLKMLGIDGIEVLRRVKRERPEVEVIILTGYGSEANKDACMAMGAFAYLEKPVDIEALNNAIRTVHERAQGYYSPGAPM